MEGYILDLIALAIVVLFTVIGWFKGFFSTLLSIIGGVGTFVIAFFCSDWVVELCENWFGLSTALNNSLGEAVGGVVAPIIAIVGACIVLRILVFVLNHTIGKLFRVSFIGGINSFLGLILGMLRGVGLVCILLAILSLAGGIEAVSNFITNTVDNSIVITHLFDWINDMVQSAIGKS